MKNAFLTIFLFCCSIANGQNYLQDADDCFDKGDYECAKRNYTLFQTYDGRDMSGQIQKADECYKTLIVADDYFKNKKYEEAKSRYKFVLDKNPKDLYAKKQYTLCEEIISSSISNDTTSSIPSVNVTHVTDTIRDIPPSGNKPLQQSENILKGNRNIYGVVLDDYNAPILGAVIEVRSTSSINGTVTDIDGQFRLTVPTNDSKLQVRCVGYKTQSLSIDSSGNV